MAYLPLKKFVRQLIAGERLLSDTVAGSLRMLDARGRARAIKGACNAGGLEVYFCKIMRLMRYRYTYKPLRTTQRVCDVWECDRV